MVDRNLVSRVRAYVVELGSGGGGVLGATSDGALGLFDREAMVEALRQRHPEYRRKTLPAFRTLVNRVCSVAPVADLLRSHSSEPKPAPGDKKPDQKPASGGSDPVYWVDRKGSGGGSKRRGMPPLSGSSSGPSSKKSRTTGDPNTPGGDPSVGSQNLSNLGMRAVYQQRQQQLRPAVRGGQKRRRIAGGGVGGGAGSSSGGSSSEWIPAVTKSRVRYSDVGGVESVLQDVRELVEYPLRHPEIYQHLGVEPPRGLLLHGPPGCGKTLLAHAIAGELGVPFFKIAGPEVVSGVSGQSEEKLRALFATAQARAPCLLFIDEIDAIAPKRATAHREMERRIVAQILSCMDSLSLRGGGSGGGSGKGDVGGDDSKSGLDSTTTSASRADQTAIVPTQPISQPTPQPISQPNLQSTPQPKLQPTRQWRPVIVIGATNRPDSLDPALRRAGRFDREISMGIPDAAARARILRVMCRGMRLAGDFNYSAIARQTAGYVGADLAALTKEAAVIAVNRIFAEAAAKQGTAEPASEGDAGDADAGDADAGDTAEADSKGVDPKCETTSKGKTTSETTSKGETAKTLRLRESASDALLGLRAPLTAEQLRPLAVTMDDFGGAVAKVQPSARREGFATAPDVTWNDVGALGALREELRMAILEPIRNPDLFESVGLSTPCGVLLYGPPGCGKTLVAKAVANESGASFLSIKGPELLNKYVGASERAVRQVFSRARASSPCVIFFDELDALCPRRGQGSEGSHVSERVVNQLLTEMDGLDARKQVFVVAATNRPDIIDDAMLRPGRLDKLLYVPLPSAVARREILRVAMRKTPLAQGVDVAALAERKEAQGFSGADLSALVREATTHALRRAFTGAANTEQRRQAARGVRVRMADFDAAFRTVLPSVSSETHAMYERLKTSLRGRRMSQGRADEAS